MKKVKPNISLLIHAAKQKKNAAEALEKSQRKTLTPEQIRANVKHKEEARRKQEALEEQQRLASHKAREKRLKEAAERKALAKRDRIIENIRMRETAPERRAEREKKKKAAAELAYKSAMDRKAKIIADFKKEKNIGDDVDLDYDEKTNRFKVKHKVGVVGEGGKILLDKKENTNERTSGETPAEKREDAGV